MIPLVAAYGDVTITPEGLLLHNSGGQTAAACVGRSDVDHPIYSDLSIRLRLMKSLRAGEVGVVLRVFSGSDAYFCAVRPATGTLFVYRGEGGRRPLGSWPANVDVCGTDTLLQVDLEGDELRLWAWEAGGERPEEPIRVTDPDIPPPPGAVAIYTFRPDPAGPPDSAVVRQLMLFAPGEEPFRRGDANSDGAVDMGDAVFVLGHLFLGSGTPSCLDAADANDDGEVELTDAVHLLGHLFLGTESPPAPWESCGVDPTPQEGLTCLRYEPCESYERSCAEDM